MVSAMQEFRASRSAVRVPLGGRADAIIGRAAAVIVVGCLAVVSATALLLAFPPLRTRLGIGPAVGPSYKTGERFDGPASLYGETPYALVLFARSSCGACQRAKPFYARLNLVAAGRPAIRVVLAVPASAPPEGERGYGREAGVDADRVFSVNFASLRLHAVPTVVLVDRSGRILDAWEGLLSSAQQDALLLRLGKLSQAP